MHDRLNHDSMKDKPGEEQATLAAALRALPAGAPTQDAWPELAARIRRRRVTRRAVWFTLPAAFAAGLALTLAWPHLQPRTHAPTPTLIAAQPGARPSASNAPDVIALQASSRQWQAWVQKLDRKGAPLDGPQLAEAVALQDRIGLVDLQLSAASKSSTTAVLWQQRITLLQQLGLLHLQPYLVATQRPASNDHLISM
ncbi:MAG TPA: hypothetical protein VFS86_00955 [Rhodanobacteraceae bacterium]|jgi:hypothetical protein|nr:hypothetical protein [Rhodanobacteraceae bacterium]